MAHSAPNLVWFRQVDKEDIALVGGKGANLGEITRAGFNVPPGFIIISKAYFNFVKDNSLELKIKHLLSTVNLKNQKSLEQVSLHIKTLIINSKISEELALEIVNNYRKLGGAINEPLVAVRSSATAEDLKTASFAGQQETFLNVKGDSVLIEKVKEAWASLYDARAIFYRHEQRFDNKIIGIALVVQKMIESEKSGVMFTIDPLSNDKRKIVIEAILGLGEMIVQGEEKPDRYEVDKESFSIISKNISTQKFLLSKKGTENKKIKISSTKGSAQKLSEKEILELARVGKDIEKHYYFPQDIEWAIEGNKVYIVQTRSVTTTKIVNKSNIENTSKTLGKLLLKGDPASPGISSGLAKVIKSSKEMDKILNGDVLVAPQTNPDYVPAMKRASAIVTDSGGRTSHAAIVSRELGIPAIVGTENATTVLKNEKIITVNGSTGEVFKGGFVKSIIPQEQIDTDIKTATKVYVNLAEPEAAERVAQRNVDGVGLLRAEFMMAEIGIHPKKLIKDGKADLFVDKLSEGLTKFCKAFNPRPIIYRTSDFKTNEYRNLTGGKDYEPLEENPMLGFRGVYRYIQDEEVFKLELKAIKRVREKEGFKNLWIMLPFVRTVEELVKVKKIINDFGLERSPHFKLWMMVEIPSNVIMLEQFIDVGIDGISIGSNDLTMLILGTDRDNSELAHEFNEMNPAVLWAFEHVVRTANKKGITSSMCGQAVSTYSELTKRLVKLGVTSVSVSPDAIENTRKLIMHFEKEHLRNGKN
ncbi:MAG: phosphoenolpyruvate synthase [Candidatus Levybacteria bacterium RIFCSPLOWO2_01_FULL_36_13]|nr:MAG: phosphoenolpyruvate synthase [Candidatus Levybacteria bacterium RIFCSPHIGHO2_01_FULL_36_15b]OGH35553.1 MAG: phosphoenolpyruvate synthase [Candidatus Levybacteria bacterium RIFCSPLOWO2_01_FULL_36_13]